MLAGSGHRCAVLFPCGIFRSFWRVSLGPPFEPIDRVGIDCLSFKTAILLALASGMRAGYLCALSVLPSCMSLPDGKELWPDPAFQPKVIVSCLGLE